MEITDFLTIAAIIIGPIAAIQAQQIIEKGRNSKNRKIEIFKTLMATRGSTLSISHVEALNRIDLEFSDNDKYKKVIEAWKEYFANLGDDNGRGNNLDLWVDKRKELFANLLYEMGNVLNFKFDKTLIKRNWYTPQGHIKTEEEHNLIRKGILNILNGEATLNITNVLDDESLKRQVELQNILINYYKNDIPLKVKVVE